MWSLEYDKCQNCGTIERKHKARGLCDLCYQKEIEQNHSFSKTKRGASKELLTEEYLRKLYFEEERSLSEIGKIAGCSRQYVNKLINEYNLPFRDKKQARTLALKRGKISVNGTDYQHVTYNERFFKVWSREMAYVLGMIFTDGTLSYDERSNQGRFSISQKEPEILEKIRLVMGTNATIYERQNNDGKDILYHIQFNNNELYNDLLSLGLTHNKSLTIQYPYINKQYESHFIRGLWDGDGSIKQTGAATFVSGSEQFAIKLHEILINYGFPFKFTERNGYYHIELYKKKEVAKFADFLYQETYPLIYLGRKFNRFREV